MSLANWWHDHLSEKSWIFLKKISFDNIQKSFVFCLLWCIFMWICIYRSVKAAARNLLRGCLYIHLLWSEVLSGQQTPETLNRSTASERPRTLRRKAPWPQEFVFENTDLAVHPSYFEIYKDRETGIPAFPGWEDKRGREISAPDREMKQ